MKPWQNALLWSLYPLLVLLSAFGFIATVNWDYESKLISLDYSGLNWSGVHLGPLLLAAAGGMALLAGFFLFLVRFFWPESQPNWFVVPLTLITIWLVFPGLFIVFLGPSAITMFQQMRSASK